MIDEIRRQKYLQALRSPAGALDPEYKAGQSIQPDVVDSPPIDLEASYTVKAPSAPTVVPPLPVSAPQMTRDQKSVPGDMMVGASHALLALLSGNHNRAAMEYGKADKYVSDRRKEDVASMSKLVKTKGPNGEPILTPTSEAADMVAYVPPDKKGAGSGKTYAPQMMRNPETKETKVASWDGSNLLVKNDKGEITETLDPNKWFKFVPDQALNTPTLTGGKNIDFRNAVTGKVDVGVHQAGRGDTAGGITKEAYDVMMKGAAKGRDESFKVQKDINELQSIKDDPNTLKDPAVFATNFGALMRATVGEKRLSDDEQAKFEGGKYKTFLQIGYNAMDGKINGKIPDDVIRNFKALHQSTMSKKAADLRAINQTYVNPGATKSAEGRDQQLRASGQNPANVAKSNKQAQAYYTQAKAISNAKVKSGTWTPEMQDKFLEQQRNKLGL